ncbi:MAG: hypothetical protein M1827_006869 [Pycnora praestabilis]|nr:MAG: hypothetical protein M1827_006869 [Pycnora praestabilis]
MSPNVQAQITHRSPYAKKAQSTHTQPHARPHRPAPLTRRATPQSIHKLGAGHSQALDKGIAEEEGMAASFPQFWKDTNKSPTYTLVTTVPSPPMTTLSPLSCDDRPPRVIIPQASPTTRRISTPFHPGNSPSSDLSNNRQSRAKISKTSSEAHDYLQKFHRTTSRSAVLDSDACSFEILNTLTRSPDPSNSSRHHEEGILTMTAPSLSSTVSSSIASSPYSFSTRPLPPRLNPDSYSAGSRSIDLVTPFTPCAGALSVPAGANYHSYSKVGDGTMSAVGAGIVPADLLYEKKWTLPSVSPSKSSLQQLFCFEEMRKRAVPTAEGKEAMADDSWGVTHQPIPVTEGKT